MSVKSTAALMTLRALVAGGADIDTPEARRAAIAAVAPIADLAEKSRLLSFIEAERRELLRGSTWSRRPPEFADQTRSPVRRTVVVSR